MNTSPAICAAGTSHTRQLSTRRAAASVILGAALAAVSIIGVAAPASAHDEVVGTTPENGATLTQLPDSFSVTMNEDLLTLDGDTGGVGIEVTDAAGRYYGDGCFSVDGPTLSTAAALGEAGDYTMVWQVVSSDGHPTSGEFSFTWAPTGDAVASVGSATAPTCGVLTATSELAAPAGDQTVPAAVWLGIGLVAIAAAVAGFVLYLARRKRA